MKNKEYSIALNWNNIGISVVLFATLTLLVLYLPGLRDFDTMVLKSVRLALSPFPSYIPLFISEFGMANHFLWPQITAACVLISHGYYLRTFMLILFTQIAFLLKEVIKEFVCRARPDGSSFSGWSFPSGHCTVSMCFFGIIIYLIHLHVRSDFWRNFLIIFFGLWIILVAISRMWLKAHFLTDVVAGLLLGFVLVNVFIIIDKSLHR